jgi:aspartyl-tRNA(Asn)/glutamyl-tRNA(Gln) amidotransferase subunit B
MSRYEPTIGIECHVQLNTVSKLFAAVSNDAKDQPPNTTVSPICFGLPGTLPVLNQAVIEKAVMAGKVLNAQVASFSKFDRKHYFYPDLPKGYQITQFDQPTVGEGTVEVPFQGKTVTVGIERAHIEEDAGKLTHPTGADYSLVDLNRAGTPLLEIVSKPDITSPELARAYTRELYLLMKFALVSDVDLFQGHMRFDVNISVAKMGAAELGTRAEVKNLNSFRAVERAAAYEFSRQRDLLERGETITQETRGWDDDKQVTFSQRGKEEAHDYRYFPDPDIPPVRLTDDQIRAWQSQVSITPQQMRQSLHAIGLKSSDTETLLDQHTVDYPIVDLIQNVAELESAAAVFCTQWLLNRDTQAQASNLPTAKQIVEVHNLYKTEGALSSNNAYQLLAELKPGEIARTVAADQNLLQMTNESEIEKIVEQVILEHPQAVADIKAGEQKAIGFLVGQVMQASKGQANPEKARDLIEQRTR